MVYQVTIHKKKKNAQNAHHLNQCMHGHPFKDPGAVANSLTGIKYELGKCPFSIQA